MYNFMQFFSKKYTIFGKIAYHILREIAIIVRLSLSKIGIIALLLVTTPVIAVADSKFLAKISVVDVESILEHSLAIKHVKKSINEISDNIEREVTQKAMNLKSMEDELIKERAVLGEEKFNLKVLEFNKKVSQTQKEMQNKKSALEEAHSKAIAQVHKVTIDIITELSKQYGFNIVLPSSQVLFVESDMNITLEVITKLNERLSTVDIKYSQEYENLR